MMFPKPKNVIFVEILLHPNFSPRNSGLPYFYRVKLDVIGFGQKAHFWNWETSSGPGKKDCGKGLMDAQWC